MSINSKFKVQSAKLLWMLAASLVIVPNLVLAQAATLSVAPNTGTLRPGCTFSVDINVDTGGAQTDGTDVILFYEPAKLAVTSITNGTIYSDYPTANADGSGKITISGVSSVSSPFSGSGKLATVNFNVPTGVTGATTLKFDFAPSDKTKTTDSNVVQRGTVQDILTSVTDGSYTVGAAGCGAAPSPTAVTKTSQGSTEVTTPAVKTPVQTDLNVGGKPPGLTGPTLILAIVGGALTIVGIVGLALL